MIIALSITLISVVIIVISVIWESIGSNIIHMQNGRKPEAGVSLMGYVITTPLFFTGIAIAGKWVSGEDGWKAIYYIFFAFLLYTLIVLPQLYIKYKRLCKEYGHS